MNRTASMAERLRVWDTLAMMKLWSAGGCEFEPRTRALQWDVVLVQPRNGTVLYDTIQMIDHVIITKLYLYIIIIVIKFKFWSGS